MLVQFHSQRRASIVKLRRDTATTHFPYKMVTQLPKTEWCNCHPTYLVDYDARKARIRGLRPESFARGDSDVILPSTIINAAMLEVFLL